MPNAKHHPPPPLIHFLRGMILHFAGGVLIMLGSLVIGMLGYEHFENLPWPDAFLNTAMLLGGMGPVDVPHSEGGKLFAGCYALYAGLVFLILMSIVMVPLFHRVLHKFHWDREH